MNFQIDQSGKIENTSKTSFVCLANDKVCIASISAKEKRILELFFRKLKKPLIFKLFTFAVLCSKVIVKAKPQSLTIDKEYISHEIDIDSFIVQILSIWGYSKVHIVFGEIGKRSSAHIQAYRAYKKTDRGDIIRAEDVLKLYNLVNKA